MSRQTKIKDARMSRDEDGKELTNNFKPTDSKLHCVVLLDKPEPGVQIKAVWTALDSSAGKNIEIASTDYRITGKDNSVDMELSLPQAWPTGKYKVDLFLESQLDRTVEFEIKA